MSFPVALQSAIFYIVACTPCAQVRHRQKAKEKAKREREEKARFEMQQPGLYQHPSPFNTNPFWQEEISRGPALPKKSGSKNSSQRGLTSSSARDESSLSVLERTITETSRPDANNSSMAVGSDDDGLSADWNRRHGYQREDEELWGEKHGAHKLKDAFSKARDSAGRLIESTLGLDKEVTEQEREDFYFTPRNPPVNDYHPPVVSNKPGHRDAHRWMLQPPPPAKIMEGKVPVNRTTSSASRLSLKVTSAGDELPLGRLVQDKMPRTRTRTDSEPTEQELIESLFENRPRSLARSRSLSLDNSDESFDHPFETRNGRLRPVVTPPGYDSSEDEGTGLPSRKDSFHSHSSQPGRAAQRPKLPTILSASSKNSSRTSVRRSRRQQKSSNARDLSGTTSPVADDTD
ncbi:hypothetical protein HJFPF1_00852 [Paramyrothecium foliicola]|nr:hypothetical protein HJFPF1_00852 [Paramyrothecium foliicola]